MVLEEKAAMIRVSKKVLRCKGRFRGGVVL